MLRDASQRGSAVEAPVLARCCDAPQHEGEGGAAYFGETNPRIVLAKRSQPRRFGETNPSGERACLARTKNQPAAVRKDRRRNSIVSGLLFTMNGATATCRARQRPSRIQVAARLPTRSSSPINPPNTGSTPRSEEHTSELQSLRQL